MFTILAVIAADEYPFLAKSQFVCVCGYLRVLITPSRADADEHLPA